MTYTVDSQELRSAILQIKPEKINKNLLVLSNAKLTFKDDKISVTATDLALAASVDLEAKDNPKPPFSVLLPMKSTEMFLRGQNGTVSIEKNPQGNLILKRKGLGECVLIPTSADTSDFPPIPHADNLKWASLDAKYLSLMFPHLITACATEFSRPVLTGIACCDGSMASADGFRLVWLQNDKLNFGLGGKQVIIPSSTAKHALRLFKGKDTVNIAFEEQSDGSLRRVYFKSGNASLVSELIIGNYPDYTQLVPSEYDCCVSFSSPLMMQRLQMIDPIIIRSGITRFVFHRKGTLKEHECLISASAEDIVSYSLTMPCKIENEGKIAFNATYVQDAIKPFSLVNLDLTSVSSPGKFTGDIEGLTIVVMPMFVQW